MCFGSFETIGAMPRKLRVEHEGAIYHVMNRGDRREPIFMDKEDQHLFLETLRETCEKTGWQVHAYCLMATAACGDGDDLAVDCAAAGDGPLADGTQCNSADRSTKAVNSERKTTPLVISDPFLTRFRFRF